MSYLQSLSPEVLRRLTTEANSTWMDPNTGMTYGAHWNQASAGNDENAATAATLTGGSIWGHSPDMMTEKKYKSGTTFDMPSYDPNTGSFSGMETGHYGGAKKDWADYMGMLMAAAVGAGGLYSAFAPGAFGGAAAEGAAAAAPNTSAMGGSSGFGSFSGPGLNPAFDTLGSLTEIGTAPMVGNGATLPMGAGGWSAATLPAAGSVPATSMMLGAAAGAAGGSGIGSFLSGLSGSDLGAMALKYGPALVGALSGAKGGAGRGAGGWDSRLDPYIFGDGKDNKGAFGYARGFLDAPIAPNGFEKYYGKG
jgi:hypothetical protein